MSAGPPCHRLDQPRTPRSPAHPVLRRRGQPNRAVPRSERTGQEAAADSVTEARRELLAAAVELGVDREDIALRSREERLLWDALEREFEVFVAKVGPVWIAE